MNGIGYPIWPDFFGNPDAREKFNSDTNLFFNQLNHWYYGTQDDEERITIEYRVKDPVAHNAQTLANALMERKAKERLLKDPNRPYFALGEIIPAARDNPVIPRNGSPITSGTWTIGRPFIVPCCWQLGAFAGLAIAGAKPTDTGSLAGMLGAATFAGAAEGLLVVFNDLAEGHTLKEALQHALCWATANFAGAAAWQVLANQFLDGLSDMTLADIDKLAGPMAMVGGSAAAIFSLVLLVTKIALRCLNPEHYGAASTETIIRDCLVFSFIFVGPTDATFCLSSFSTWFNSGELGGGFAEAGLAAVLKQVALSATGAFAGGMLGLGIALLCHGLVFKAAPYFVELVTKYMEENAEPGKHDDFSLTLVRTE